MRLLTIDEVAEILSVSRARTYELARTGALPTVRLGRQVRVSEGALRQFIDSGGYKLAGGCRAAPAGKAPGRQR